MKSKSNIFRSIVINHLFVINWIYLTNIEIANIAQYVASFVDSCYDIDIIVLRMAQVHLQRMEPSCVQPAATEALAAEPEPAACIEVVLGRLELSVPSKEPCNFQCQLYNKFK